MEKNGKKIHRESVYRWAISDEFYVECMNSDSDDGAIDFWLCRKDYGLKTYIFGVPNPDKSITATFAEYQGLFCDKEYMRIFLDDLLEHGEIVNELFEIVG